MLRFSVTGAAVWSTVNFLPSDRATTKLAQRTPKQRQPRKERADLLNRWSIQFVGRRKLDGGYVYHDFMQNRNFDIAGPNPTPEELKRIDEEYIDYLDIQRREVAFARAFPKKQSEVDKTDSDVDRTGNVGPPMVITPMNLPTPEIKDSTGRSKLNRCVDGSLSCSWSKLSAGIREVFESTSRTKR